MKVSLLSAVRQVTPTLVQLELSAQKAIALRRELRRVEEALADYDTVLKDWATKQGIDGKPISELSPEQLSYWQELMNTEVEVTLYPVLGMSDFTNAKLSVYIVDALILAGLLKEEQSDAKTEADDVSGAATDVGD